MHVNQMNSDKTRLKKNLHPADDRIKHNNCLAVQNQQNSISIIKKLLPKPHFGFRFMLLFVKPF